MNHFFNFLFLLYLSSIAYGQRHCATDHIKQQHILKNPALQYQHENFKEEISHIIQNNAKPLGLAAGVYSIPVVVHVIYNGTAATNISDAQVLSQIEVLNEDFRRKPATNGFNNDAVGADTEIEFCLASRDPDGAASSGINRVFHSKTTWGVGSSDETLLKSLSYWPSNQYLNIWVCRMDIDYLGYAQYPGGGAAELDGVVVDYRAFGTVGAAGTGGRGLYSLGRTTSHEVGHWLGLFHIWGEGNGCGSDQVSDTPLDAGANGDADCIDSSDCDNNSVYVQDMTNNYLDYSPDVCMNIFTQGQKTRMRTVLETDSRRLSLLSSTGCLLPLAIGSRSVPSAVTLQSLLESQEDVFCEIYDLSGKKIYATWLNGTNKSLPLESLTGGIYIVKANTKNKYVVQRIVHYNE